MAGGLLVLAGAVLAFVLGEVLRPRSRAESPPPAADPFVPPLNDAVVGEEVRLHRGPLVSTYRVARTTDDEVQVEFFESYEGTPPAGWTAAPAKTYVWRRNGFGVPEDFVVRRADPDRIDVGGRSFDCWRLTCHSRAGLRFYWISDRVPVHGVLRIAPDLDGDGGPDVALQADLLWDSASGDGSSDGR